MLKRPSSIIGHDSTPLYNVYRLMETGRRTVDASDIQERIFTDRRALTDSSRQDCVCAAVVNNQRLCHTPLLIHLITLSDHLCKLIDALRRAISEPDRIYLFNSAFVCLPANAHRQACDLPSSSLSAAC